MRVKKLRAILLANRTNKEYNNFVPCKIEILINRNFDQNIIEVGEDFQATIPNIKKNKS